MSDLYEYPFNVACRNTFVPVRSRGQHHSQGPRFVRVNPYALGPIIDIPLALRLTGIRDRRTLRKHFPVVRDQLGREGICKPVLIAFFASLEANNPHAECNSDASHERNIASQCLKIKANNGEILA